MPSLNCTDAAALLVHLCLPSTPVPVLFGSAGQIEIVLIALCLSQVLISLIGAFKSASSFFSYLRDEEKCVGRMIEFGQAEIRFLYLLGSCAVANAENLIVVLQVKAIVSILDQLPVDQCFTGFCRAAAAVFWHQRLHAQPGTGTLFLLVFQFSRSAVRRQGECIMT